MTRRLAVLVVAVLAALTGVLPSALAAKGGDHGKPPNGDPWVCVANRRLDVGYCQYNPLPDLPGSRHANGPRR